MPQITEKDGQYCLEGYGDADKCYPTEDEAKAAQAKLSEGESKEVTPPVELSKEVEERLVIRVIKALTDVTNRARGRKEDTDFTGFKVVGNHFLVVYSNNFKDRDQQFFPQREIDNYIARVDMGIIPKPELMVWHAGKQAAIGIADMVARHGHFTLAAGQFYGSDLAQTAKAYYEKHAKDTGISHGFTHPSKEFDGKHFKGFNTFEISLLPRGSEANWYTSLEGVKELQVDEKKQQYLEEVFGKEHAARILSDWDKRGKALEELNVEFKDFVATDDGAGDSATAHKEAVDTANKSLVELFPDLMEGSAESVDAALEAVKAVKAEKAARVLQDGVIADLQKQLKDIRAELDLKPRSASTDAATVIDEGKISKEVQDMIKQQTTVKHPFWGTEVSQTL